LPAGFPQHVLDAILHGLVEEELSAGEIGARGFDPATVAEAYRGALAAAFRLRHTREPGDIERRSDDHAQR
jgi:hypothetical protein